MLETLLIAGAIAAAAVARPPSVVARELFNAKSAEDKAKKQRIELEDELMRAVVLPAHTKGAKTYEIEDFKITVDKKWTVKFDIAAFDQIADQIPAELRPIKTTTTRDLDADGAEWLKHHRPDLWAIVAKAITTTPAKSAVTVKPLSL